MITKMHNYLVIPHTVQVPVHLLLVTLWFRLNQENCLQEYLA